MDIEKLKVCAEALGLTPMVTVDGIYVNYFHDLGTKEYGVLNQKFDPLHNDAQAFELLKWLLHDGGDWEVSAEDETRFLIWSEERQVNNNEGYSNEVSSIIGDTLNEAIVNAVWEVKHG